MADLSTMLRPMIGLVMLLVPYFALRRRKSGRERAIREAPALAVKLGLEHKAPSDPSLVGALRGRHRGREVFVDADERPRIVVYLAGAPAIVLRTFEHEKRVPSGMERFDTGSGGVDRLFKERFADAGLSAELSARKGDLESALEPVLGQWRERVAHLSVTSERVECAFDFGKPPHVPPEAVEALVPALVRFAEVLDSAWEQAHAGAGAG